MTFLEALSRYRDELTLATLEHLALVAAAILIASAIGIPLGVASVRRPLLRRWALGLTNAVQTIPSLALFGLLIPLAYIGGVGTRPAIVAMTLYALLPIVRNAYVGVSEVDPAVRESAVAMGMTDRQILRMVELPLASRTILAGLRVAAVTAVGVATIAALIGAGGLGRLIYTGLQTVNTPLVLLGAVPAALLALAADLLLGLVEKKLSPKV